MRVLYDYQVFEHQVYGGISRYHYELLKGADSHPDFQWSLPLLRSSNHYINLLPRFKGALKSSDDYERFFLRLEFPGKWRLFKTWQKLFGEQQRINQRASIEALQKGEFDVFHPTDLDDYFIPYLNGKPFVITIHDMIDEIFPEYGFHVHSNYRTSVKEKLIRQAAGIVAVSENTKQDIIDRFDIHPDRIRVIHHGVSGNTNVSDGSSRVVEGPYFLFIGKRTHYKNFYFLLQCLQSFLLENRKLKVLCCGAPFNEKEKNYFRDLNIEQQIIHVDASDNKLTSLYQHAVAFLYPSQYEGFGMPILEAFQLGCPVLTTPTSSIPEVAADAALYFEPKKIISVQDAVRVIMVDQDKRKELIEKGHHRASAFTWENTVRKHVEFYKELVE